MGDDMIFPPGMPEELQEKVKMMFDRQKMAGQVTRQSISRFFQELSEDQLNTFKLILNMCSSSEGAAPFYEGLAAGVLAHKFNRWPGWNDEGASMVAFEFDPNGSTLEATEVPIVEGDKPTEWYTQKCNEYNVTASDSTGDDKVTCKGCGTEYVSLDDRMLRPPGIEGCSVCVQRQKWG